MQNLRRMLTLVVVLFFAAIAQPASAQSGQLWLPEFDAGKHVQVDPKLKNHRSYPLDLSALEATAVNAGEKHGLAIYIIATEARSDPSGADIAIPALEDLSARWQSRPGFPKDNYLILLWVRYSDIPNKGEVAAQGGNRFSDYNMLGGYFDDPNRGPVIPNLRRYMPQDPVGAFSGILSSVNRDIDTWKAGEADRIAAAERAKVVPYYIGGGVSGALFIGLIIFLALRFSGRKKKALAAKAEFDAKLAAADERYVQLNGSYLGFLNDQGDWQSKFKGKTLASFTRACKDYADFGSRHKKAKELSVAADKAIKSAGWPRIGKLDEALAILTSTPVAVTGEDLPLEHATLFGGLVEKADYTPPQLLAAMEELFDRTNKALAAIVAAFEGAKKNRSDIEGLLAQIEDIKPELTAAELVFDPYEKSHAEIKTGQAGFIAILTSDPLEAFAGSENVESLTESLKAALKRAISIKTSLPGVLEKLDAAATKTAKQRGLTATYAYQLVESETAPEGDAGNFRLDERNGNPDPLVKTGRERLAKSHEHVWAGQLDLADKAKTDAIELASEASKLIDDVVAAKAFVEGKVTPARTTLAGLTSEIEGARPAVAELESDFLKANAPEEPAKLTTAISVKDSTPGLLATVKEHYDNQRFRAARELLMSVQGSINSSRTALTQVHARLAELQRLRQDSRDTVARSLKSSTTVGVHIRDNTFTTSRATDQRYADATGELAALKTTVDAKISDWPKASADAHRIEKELAAIDSQITTEREAYDNAKQAVASLSTAITKADEVVSDDRVRQAAHNELNEARTSYGALSERLRTAKSDWATLKSQADDAKEVADSAKKKGNEDIEEAEEAATAIQVATAKIADVANNRYDYGVRVDLSSARLNLQQAHTAYGNRDYADAKREAGEAVTAANSAHRNAEREEDSRKPKPPSTGGGIGGGISVGGGSRRTGGSTGSFGSSSGGRSVGGRTGGGKY